MILDHRADLYEACQRLCPIDPAYANLPIEEGFNWFSCLGGSHAYADTKTGTTPLSRVKGCAGCNWFFVDESKNRSRRWCSMEECDTHAKIRRYVARRAGKRKDSEGRST